MKKFMRIFMCLICLLGFTTSVNAASSTITAYNSGTMTYEYINGLPIYWNKSGSYNLYVLDYKTYYSSSTRLSEPTEVDAGFAYIINNSNVTGNSEKNYYIAQVAILWYEDYLNGNNANISSSMKEIIASKTNDTICYYINKLVNNAKTYSKTGNLINFVDDEITFYRNGSYYYSNEIEVEVNGLNSVPTISYYNAPTNTTTINNYLTKNGTGSFQIRIPVSSVDYNYNNNYNYNYNNYNEDFIVNVTGNGYNYTYYEYSNGNTLNAIYGYSYSSYSNKIEASMVAKLSNSSDTNVRIFVLDDDNDYISGIKYNLYSEDCSKTTCNSNKLVETFTTKNTYTELYNLSEGTYTLVRMNGNSYNLPEKEVIEVEDTQYLQDFTIVQDKYNNSIGDYESDYDDSVAQYKVNIYTNLNDSTNVIKIYRSDDVFVSSFRANKSSYEVILYPDTYYIVDSRGIKISFEVSKDGSLYLIENGKKTSVNSININKEEDSKVDNVVNNTTNNNNNNSKEEITTQDGTIHIDNLDGVDSIDVTQKVDTTTDVKVEWLSNIIDCPITSLSSTLKYIVGAIILGAGLFMVILNVKKRKNNI